MGNDTALAIGILFWIVFVVGLWLLSSYILYRVGKKFGIGTFWDYCIPIYNSVLLCRCARISPWNLLWILVPVGNIVFPVVLWGKIAERLKHDFWVYGLGIYIFAIPVLILAFDDSKPESEQVAVTGPTMYCVSGEFAGNHMPIGPDGIIIGRSPSKANLVLSSLEVSAMHARVWSDREGRIWVQDMSSSNGTFYSKMGTGKAPEWVEVKGPVALTSGAHVRVGDNAAEFVIS
jgi:hypothetical protein